MILCAVDPAIGGVLVRGEKGTAKSTTVRAFARLLSSPTARLVELPIGATEDRVVGSIDVRGALADGVHRFAPGLLADADGGVLYVDEVNLLADHLVDVLLDAAAMGRVHVERDSISESYPSRFVLVGTMNPEEGELRPQLLDRFGFAVDVAASRDVDVRVEVTRRRLAYDADPDAFARRWRAEDEALAESLARARAALAGVELPDAELRRIASVCASLDVEGMRADLVVARAARSHAAWRGHDTVDADDVRVAVELALPHRRRRDPFDEPGLDDRELDQAFDEAAADDGRTETDESGQGDAGGGEPGGDGPSDPETGGGDPDGPDGPDDPGGGGAPTPSGARADNGSQFRARRLEVPGMGTGASGRRSRSRSERGAVVRATARPHGGLHVPGTVLAALPHQHERATRGDPLRGTRGDPLRGTRGDHLRGTRGGTMVFAADDARGAQRRGREGNLVVFLVDASGSMAARDRLSAVTGAVVSLLRDAYLRRDKVAVVVARGRDATVALPPTGSVDVAVRRLGDLRTGGKSPLAQGFATVSDVLRRERLRDPHRRALLVALTDGRATGGRDALPSARRAARALARGGLASVVVDCESGMVRLGLAAQLARDLGGDCLQLAELSADHVAGVVRAAAA
nr:VWA domain-containing protein [Rhodococcus sp. HNM0569]